MFVTKWLGFFMSIITLSLRLFVSELKKPIQIKLKAFKRKMRLTEIVSFETPLMDQTIARRAK